MVLAFASVGSLSDVGTAASLVAAGGADAVVLVGSDGLSVSAADVVRDAAPVRAVLVGGTAVLPAEVGSRIEELSDGVSVERVAGTDRAATAAEAARRVAAGVQELTVVLANGWSLADVGVAASLVAAGGADVVLYGGIDALGDATADALGELAVSELIAVGGTAALPQTVVDAAAAAAGVSDARRFSGSTRMHTAARAARAGAGDCTDTVVIVNGWSDADVGAAAALAAALEDAAVLYTQDADTAGDVTVSALERLDPVRIVIIGGTDTVSDALAESLTASSPRRVDRYEDPAAATQHALNRTATACDTGGGGGSGGGSGGSSSSRGSSGGGGGGGGSGGGGGTPPQQQPQERLPGTSSNARLSDLTADPGGYAFDVGDFQTPLAFTRTFDLTVNYDTETLTVTAAPEVTDADVDILPRDADAGTVGHQVTLNTADRYDATSLTTITVKVTATDTITTKTFQINVIRAGDPSTNPLLRSLEIDPGGGLWPAFDAARGNYDVPVDNDTDTVTVAAGPAVTGSEVEISPEDADAGTLGHQVALNATGMYGAKSDTIITVKVTATDGTTTKTYRITVNRSAATAWERDAGKDIFLPTKSLYLPPIPYDAERDGTGPWSRFEPGGIWSDGTTLWASDGAGKLIPNGISDRPLNIYAYNLSTGARDESKDIHDPTDASGLPSHLWSDTETMWVLNYPYDVAHAIDMSTGEVDDDKTFDALERGGGYGGTDEERVWGIGSDGTTLYVAIVRGWGRYRTSARIAAYSLDTHTRDSGKDINSLWAVGNKTPGGMWSDGITLWVADSWDVFAYNLATGNLQTHLKFNASFNYTEALDDIWSDGRTMWVSYDQVSTRRDDYLRGFKMPPTGLLYSLTLSGTDVPDVPFQTGISSYEVEVPAETISVTVEAVPAFADSQVTILPADSDAGTTGHQVNTATGTTEITITSVNGRNESNTDGGDVRMYTITVNRPS